MEVFIDPICPFSKKAYEMTKDLATTLRPSTQDQDGAQFALRYILWLQPYHAQTPLIAKILFAVKSLSPEKFFLALDAVYENRATMFTDAQTASLTQVQMVDRTAQLVSEATGLAKGQIVELAIIQAETLQDLRWHTRYGRQNGVHWSPTFMINGLIVPGADSTWSLDQWVELLTPLLKKGVGAASSPKAGAEKSGHQHQQPQQHQRKEPVPEDVRMEVPQGTEASMPIELPHYRQPQQQQQGQQGEEEEQEGAPKPVVGI